MRSDWEKIMIRLQFSAEPLAAHEMGIEGMSENSLSTRLPEMARAGIVRGEFRKGKTFKEWALVKKERNGQLLAF